LTLLPKMTGVLIKIVSSLFYLVSGLLWKKILPRGLNYHLIFYRTIFSILFSLVVISFFSFLVEDGVSLNRFFKASFEDWLFAAAICFFSFYGLYYFTNALKHGRYTVVAPFISMAALFSFVTAYFLYDEAVGMNAILSFLLLFGALVYHQFTYLKTFRLSKEIYLCLLASLFWGVSFVLYPISIKTFGVYNFSLILEVCVLLSCVYLAILKENTLKLTLPNKGDLKVCFWIGLCVAGGNVGANYSLENIPIYLNIIIAVLFEAVMILAGLYWFKEKLRMRDWALVTGITVGTVLLML